MLLEMWQWVPRKRRDERLDFYRARRMREGGGGPRPLGDRQKHHLSTANVFELPVITGPGGKQEPFTLASAPTSRGENMRCPSLRLTLTPERTSHLASSPSHQLRPHLASPPHVIMSISIRSRLIRREGLILSFQLLH